MLLSSSTIHFCPCLFIYSYWLLTVFTHSCHHIIYILLHAVLIWDVLNQADNWHTFSQQLWLTPVYFGFFPEVISDFLCSASWIWVKKTPPNYFIEHPRTSSGLSLNFQVIRDFILNSIRDLKVTASSYRQMWLK